VFKIGRVEIPEYQRFVPTKWVTNPTFVLKVLIVPTPVYSTLVPLKNVTRPTLAVTI
jgi:hypothetical protein